MTPQNLKELAVALGPDFIIDLLRAAVTEKYSISTLVIIGQLPEGAIYVNTQLCEKHLLKFLTTAKQQIEQNQQKNQAELS
jgi:hypothetical protein